MKRRSKWLRNVSSVVALAWMIPAAAQISWSTVANNASLIPGVGSPTTFSSFNQPSVNASGVVVFRARSKGPNEPVRGVYYRDMSKGTSIVKVADTATQVPYPNNTDASFNEFPSFPRIDYSTIAIATRGNSNPYYEYTLPDGTDTKIGTSGAYLYYRSANLFQPLRFSLAVGQLGAVPGFSYEAVPGIVPLTKFDQFPGGVVPIGITKVAFKGNYTEIVGGVPVSRTGIFYRDVLADGGLATVQHVASSSATLIPGTATLFGSTAPPSAAAGVIVFTGFDNEESPTLGGVYSAPIAPSPALTTLAGVGGLVPDWTGTPLGPDIVFTRFGEGLSLSGTQVAFWGAWGSETKDVILTCPADGNAAIIEACVLGSPLKDPGLDPTVPSNHTGVYVVAVPVNQGVFVHDMAAHVTRMAARTGDRFQDFLFWVFSGRPPGAGGGTEDGEGEVGEPPRWRSSAFIALDALSGSVFRVAFKALEGAMQGIYLTGGPGETLLSHVTLVDTVMTSSDIDAEAPAGLPVISVGIERDGFRNGWLAVAASMASEEAGWAGLYVTQPPSTIPVTRFVLQTSTDRQYRMWALSEGEGMTAALTTPKLAWKLAGFGDFDGNGNRDILWRRMDTGINNVWLMAGAQIASNPNLPVKAPPWEIAAVGDFNKDGKADILWRNGTALEIWYLDTSTRPFGIASVAPVSAPPAGFSADVQVVAVGDFNGDGRTDIVWRDPASLPNPTYFVWLMAANGTYVAAAMPTPRSVWQIEGVGDFDGDGTDDILWRTIYGENNVWLMGAFDASGRFSFRAGRHPNLPSTPAEWLVRRVDDFDGDGLADILWRSSADIAGTVDYFITYYANNNPTSVTWSASGMDAFAGEDADWNVVKRPCEVWDVPMPVCAP